MRLPSLTDGRTTKEQIDLLVHNVQGATISLGLPVVFTTTAASTDGRKVVLPATNNIRAFAGIAIRDIPNNEAGAVRIFGWCDSVAVYAHGTSASFSADAALGVVAGSQGVSGTGLTTVLGPVINLTSIGAAVTSPGGYVSGFIKGM